MAMLTVPGRAVDVCPRRSLDKGGPGRAPGTPRRKAGVKRTWRLGGPPWDMGLDMDSVYFQKYKPAVFLAAQPNNFGWCWRSVKSVSLDMLLTVYCCPELTKLETSLAA